MFLMNSSAGGRSAMKRSVLYDRVNTFLWNDSMLLIRAIQVSCFPLDMKEKLSNIHYMPCTWFTSYLLVRIKYQTNGTKPVLLLNRRKALGLHEQTIQQGQVKISFSSWGWHLPACKLMLCNIIWGRAGRISISKWEVSSFSPLIYEDYSKVQLQSA